MGQQATLFTAMRDRLIALRDRSPNRARTDWEIRLYEFILQDPDTRGPEYQQARFDPALYVFRSREQVAKILGWEIT